MALPKFRKKGKWILLVTAAIFLLVIALNTGRERERLTFVEVWFRDLLAPLQSGAMAVFNGTKGISDYFTGYQNVIKERDQLKKEIADLKEEVNILREARLENVRLKKLLLMKESMDVNWQITPAKVIARNMGNWYHSITIDQGQKAGLEKDMAVINYDGLVGRIISVSKNTSEVLLLLDREGAVGSLVQLSRTPGVVEGQGPQKLLRMVHFPYDADVKENQVVLTSGLGGIYPAGLRIGYITKVMVEPNGLMQQAEVEPFVDFDSLEEVMVLTEPISGGKSP